MAESSLFFSAFVSGSILPGSSEALLLYWLIQGESLWWMIIVASLGNSLGGASVYALGLAGNYARIERFVGVDKQKIDNHIKRVNHYGPWAAFFSFLPIIGDLILLVLGVTKAPVVRVLALMSIGKLMRYVVIAQYHPEVEKIWRGIFDFLT